MKFGYAIQLAGSSLDANPGIVAQRFGLGVSTIVSQLGSKETPIDPSGLIVVTTAV